MALLALLRVFPDDLDRFRNVVRHTHVPALLAEARSHGLSALIQHALTRAELTLDEPHASALKRDAMGMAGGTLRAKALLLEALELLEAADVSPIVIKGYALGARLYPEPLLRPTSDVDVFISDAEVARASAALIGKGFRPMDEAAEAYHREHHHHTSFAGSRGSIELHFRLMTGFDAVLGGDAERHRAVTRELEGRRVRLLSPEDEALYLAAHAANHLFGRVSWLYDLKLLTRSTELEWKVVAERARAANLHGPVYLAFAVAQRVLGASVPAQLESLFQVGRWHRGLAELAFTDAQLESSVWLERKWSGFVLNAAMSSDAASRWRYLRHHAARGVRRRVARRFPDYVPQAWRG